MGICLEWVVRSTVTPNQYTQKKTFYALKSHLAVYNYRQKNVGEENQHSRLSDTNGLSLIGVYIENGISQFRNPLCRSHN